jgi:hypothetical protein
LRAFYEGRAEPLWLRSPEAIRTLLKEPAFLAVDASTRGPDLAAGIERALGDAEQGIPGAAREAEWLMSSAFVLYVQALRSPGQSG